MSKIDPIERVARLRRAQPTRKRELDDRLPQGQFVTEKFPVLTYGAAAKIDLDIWRLRVTGLVEEEFELDWQELTSLPTTRVEADIHCVTRWTKLDTAWEGVAVRDLALRAGLGGLWCIRKAQLGRHRHSPRLSGPQRPAPDRRRYEQRQEDEVIPRGHHLPVRHFDSDAGE